MLGNMESFSRKFDSKVQAVVNIAHLDLSFWFEMVQDFASWTTKVSMSVSVFHDELDTAEVLATDFTFNVEQVRDGILATTKDGRQFLQESYTKVFEQVAVYYMGCRTIERLRNTK